MRFVGYTLGDESAPQPEPEPEFFEERVSSWKRRRLQA